MFSHKADKGAQFPAVHCRRATYLGGLAAHPKRRQGTLLFSSEGIGIDRACVPLADVVGVEVADQQARMSGGTVGGWGSMRSVASCGVSVRTSAGETAVFAVQDSALNLKTVLGRYMSATGLSFTDEAAPTASAADEFAKLAALHRQGILTTDEFSAAKARLLAGR